MKQKDKSGLPVKRQMIDEEHYQWVLEAGRQIYKALNRPGALDTRGKMPPEQAKKVI